MKFLKLCEDIFDEWDEDETPDLSIKVGDYVTINNLYDKFPGWSSDRRYKEANNSGLEYKVVRVGEGEGNSSQNIFFKRRDEDVFYVPIEVTTRLDLKNENFEWDEDDFDEEEFEESDISLDFLEYLQLMTGASTISNKQIYRGKLRDNHRFYNQNNLDRYEPVYTLFKSVIKKFKNDALNDIDIKWVNDINSIVKYENSRQMSLTISPSNIKERYRYSGTSHNVKISLNGFIEQYKKHYNHPDSIYENFDFDEDDFDEEEDYPNSYLDKLKLINNIISEHKLLLCIVPDMWEEVKNELVNKYGIDIPFKNPSNTRSKKYYYIELTNFSGDYVSATYWSMTEENDIYRNYSKSEIIKID